MSHIAPSHTITSNILKQIDLEKKLEAKKPLTIKMGIDPTAPHIHLGHSVILSKLKAFQEQGHTIKLIIGDFTARVGDPTGRDKTRPKLSKEDIKINCESFLQQAQTFLDIDKIEILFNSQWLKMDDNFLMETLASVTVAQILAREDFQTRMNDNRPISMLELVYPLLQAQDSVEVEADVELGGSDQLFNLMMGRTLQEKEGQAPQAVLMMPILTGTDGVKKMSKTFDNHISPSHSPEDVFGRTMSIPDTLIEEWFQLIFNQKPSLDSPLENKRLLARSIVELLHPRTSIQAQEHFDKSTSKKAPNNIEEVTMQAEQDIIHLPIFLAKAFDVSKSQARRLIKSGAIKIDEKTIQTLNVNKEDLNGKIIRKGRHFRKATII